MQKLQLIREIIEYQVTLRTLVHEHSSLMRSGYAYSERLTKIEKEIEKIQIEASGWSDSKNCLYLEIFPLIPQAF